MALLGQDAAAGSRLENNIGAGNLIQRQQGGGFVSRGQKPGVQADAHVGVGNALRPVAAQVGVELLQLPPAVGAVGVDFRLHRLALLLPGGMVHHPRQVAHIPPRLLVVEENGLAVELAGSRPRPQHRRRHLHPARIPPGWPGASCPNQAHRYHGALLLPRWQQAACQAQLDASFRLLSHGYLLVPPGSGPRPGGGRARRQRRYALPAAVSRPASSSDIGCPEPEK